MTVQHELSAQARNFNWLLTSFVEGPSGVTLAVAVSSDGLLMAMSELLAPAVKRYLFVSSVSDGSSLGVLASRGCDIGSVGYQIGLLVERAGSVLTPALVAELKESVLS